MGEKKTKKVETWDNAFVSIRVDDIETAAPLDCNIYLMINNRFLLYRRQGDTFSQADLDRLMMKNVRYFFIPLESYDLYKTRQIPAVDIESSPHESVRKTGKEFVEKAEAVTETVEKMFSSGEEGDDIEVENVQEATTTIVDFVTSQKYTAYHLEAIKRNNTTLYQHSTNVAFLATYIAIGMKITSKLVLENICSAGMLHDIGKTRLNIDIMKKEADFSDEEMEEIRRHPLVGKNILLATTNLPREVLRMVYEHHEYYDGSGYPKVLRGEQIFGLTKFITFADLFDNVMGKEVDIHESNKTLKTFDIIIKKYRLRFTPSFIKKVTEIFKDLMGG